MYMAVLIGSYLFSSTIRNGDSETTFEIGKPTPSRLEKKLIHLLVRRRQSDQVIKKL
jgi:hypothetical protein